MKRTYLAPAGLALAATILPLVPWPLVSSPLARAADLFDSLAVEGSRFAVLARPVGVDEWNLLVLEQIQSQPQCWVRRPDGLIDPSLNRFDFTGICNRYLDSNGFSLRVSRQDLATTHRLRLQQVGGVLQLQATSPEQPTVLVVGRGTVPRRDRDGFVLIQLDPGWQLERRTFSGRSLNHVYFANASSLPQLIAQASLPHADQGLANGPGNVRRGRLRRAPAPLPAPEAVVAPTAWRPASGPPMAVPGRPIPRQGIPYDGSLTSQASPGAAPLPQ